MMIITAAEEVSKRRSVIPEHLANGGQRGGSNQGNCSSSPLCTEEISTALQKNSRTTKERRDSAENNFREWIPTKCPDQTHSDSTIKKARVSVRARSEAPIVSQIKYNYTKPLNFHAKISASPIRNLTFNRFRTGANGENTAKKWLKETHALELTTAAPWPWAVPCVNKSKGAPTTGQSW